MYCCHGCYVYPSEVYILCLVDLESIVDKYTTRSFLQVLMYFCEHSFTPCAQSTFVTVLPHSVPIVLISTQIGNRWYNVLSLISNISMLNMPTVFWPLSLERHSPFLTSQDVNKRESHYLYYMQIIYTILFILLTFSYSRRSSYRYLPSTLPSWAADHRQGRCCQQLCTWSLHNRQGAGRHGSRQNQETGKFTFLMLNMNTKIVIFMFTIIWMYFLCWIQIWYQWKFLIPTLEGNGLAVCTKCTETGKRSSCGLLFVFV